MGQGADEGFVDHIVDHGAGGVVAAGFLAGGEAGFGVDGGQQVFEDFAQEFRVQGHFLLGGGVFLDGEFVAVEKIDEAGVGGVGAEKEAVGVAELAVVGVGEAVDAVAAGVGGLLAVEAIEQAAVDEGGLRQELQQPWPVGDLVGVAVAGKDAVGRRALGAEAPFRHGGVEGGEKQVLQHGAIPGIAGVAVVVGQQVGDLVFDEQILGHQSLFLEEPDE